VRFINRITPVEVTRLANYLTQAPKPPKGLTLPLSGYLHQDTFGVPDHSYAVNVIQTIQPQPTSTGTESASLILDIDVFVAQPFAPVDTFYLEDIRQSASKVAQYTHGMILEQFGDNSLVFDAVVRNLGIIGEAARQLPDEAKAMMPEVEW
jgi:hypothetical protein